MKAFIRVVPVAHFADVEKAMASIPGTKRGKCEYCAAPVLLAPSTQVQKAANPDHEIVCADCIDPHLDKMHTVASFPALMEAVAMERKRQS